MHFDLSSLLTSAGYFGIYSIVFAESGLFFGFFLPGDSLLVTAGLLATQGIFSIVNLLIFTPIAAIAGDSVGYWMGNKVGHKIFNKEKSLIFNPNHIVRANEFYKKYGKKTIVIARFVPIVRTFAPIVAGAANMNYGDFIRYNVIGGFLWTWSTLLLGYFLGRTIPDVDKYLIPIIGVIILLSLVPPAVEHYKSNKTNTSD